MALSENESTNKTALPWIEYNDHFTIIKLLKDQLTYQTYEVKCKHCVTTKSRTADTRSKTNLRNHLKVSTLIFIIYTSQKVLNTYFEKLNQYIVKIFYIAE